MNGTRRLALPLAVPLALLALAGSVIGVMEPVRAANPPSWLTRVNQHRASAGVQAAGESSKATAGSLAHSHYLVLNRTIGHDESPGKPGYSNAGRQAGLTGNVAAGSGKVPLDTALVDQWMSVPFHGVGIIGPENLSMGFGTARKGTSWAATLSLFFEDFMDEADESSTENLLQGAVDAVVVYDPSLKGQAWNASGNINKITVVMGGRTFIIRKGVVTEVTNQPEVIATTLWPGSGKSVSLLQYGGSEWPDPLSGCPGYTSKAGLPIYILRGRPTELKAATLTEGATTSIPLCILSAQTFKGRDAGSQQTARDVLDGYGAVVLFPKRRLTAGKSYKVVAETTDGDTISWSFSTTAK